MRKRGMSHLEIILGFFLFIGAVVLGVTYARPFGKEAMPAAESQKILDEISGFASTTVEIYTAIVYSGSMTIDNRTLTLNLSLSPDDNRTARVENASGSLIPAKHVLPNTPLAALKGTESVFVNWTRNGKAIKIYLGNEIPAYFPDSVDLDDKQIAWNPKFYNLSSVYSESVFLESKMQELTMQYASDYEGMKNALKVPATVDFNFKFTLDSGEIYEGQKNSTRRAEVFSYSISKDTLKNNSRRVGGKLEVNTW
jgi:hypothetical protein